MATFSLYARRAIEATRNAKMLAQLARESGVVLERPAAAEFAPDPMGLRGIPAIGRGVAGAMAHTRPGANLQ